MCLSGQKKKKYCRDKHKFCRASIPLSRQKMWRELPQVSFLSRQNTSKRRDRTFVATNIYRNKHNFIATKVMSREAYFCRDKHVFLATKLSYQASTLLSEKTRLFFLLLFFVAAKFLSRQAYFCGDKRSVLSRKNFCCDRNGTCGSSDQ